METLYKSVDGHVYKYEESALRRDKELRIAVEITDALGPRSTEMGFMFAGTGYHKHKPSVIVKLKKAFIQMLNENKGMDLNTKFENAKKHTYDNPPNYYVLKIWYRLMAIDEKGREWGSEDIMNSPDKKEVVIKQH